MTRPLLTVAPRDVPGALRDALAGGPAILPLPEGHQALDLPATVSQRTALVVETSGSTGRPKRVALGADALLASAAASETALGGPGQWLLALPTHYIAGINVLTRSFAARTRPVALEGRFDARAFIEVAERMDAHRRYTSLVPTQLGRLLDESRALAVLRRFDGILLGGQAPALELLERAAGAGVRVTVTYGSSETSGGCVYDGVPIGNTRVRVVDGEVQLGGSVLAEGYLGDDELTAERFVGGWYRTGDRGELIDGLLRVTGRLDDVIISGGVKVSLGEVERVVRARPGFAEALVVGVPHPEWGEAPVVVAERGAFDEAAALAELRAAVGAALGPAARPARLLVVERIPLLPSGKPDRRTLAASLQSPSDR